MALFRFRPQPALDLRRRQETAAAGLAADARRASELAEAERLACQARFEEAAQRAAAADAAGGDVTIAIWYRNWMRSQRRELARAEAVAEDRRVTLRDAEARLTEARRRVRVLERLRTRALDAHLKLERAREQKALDELAVLQFAIRQRGERT